MNLATTRPRYEAIDALRGFAVLGMSFSGMVAAKGLPAWMYHAQRDPSVFGITWVDLVFPFFIFALGAALAFVIESKVAEGEKPLRIVAGLGLRGLLLGIFALVGEHWRPYVMSASPGPRVWVLAIIGFVAIIAMFARWPSYIAPRWHRPLTIGGWLVAVGALPFLQYPNGETGFANYRNDVILMVLANVSLFGGLIYLFTRGNVLARLAAAMGILLVVQSFRSGGIGQLIWDWTPMQYLSFGDKAWGRYVPIFYHFEYNKYLLIALPGTICGEIMMRRPGLSDQTHRNDLEAWSLTTVFLLASVVIPIGLLARDIWMSLLGLAFLAGFSRHLIKSVDSDHETLLLELWGWGTALMSLGLLAEPIGGGIRKDGPTTLSYYFVCAGVAFYATGGLVLLIDRLKQSWLHPIIETGKNPILAYVAITNLITGVAGLVKIEDLYGRDDMNPWLLTAIGFAKTMVVMVFVAWASRKKFFVRA